MADEERTARQSDVEYWGLTLREQVHYFGRLSAYYGRLAARCGASSERYGRIAGWLRLATLFVVALALLPQLIVWVLR